MSCVGKVLLGERLYHIHVEAFSVLLTLVPVARLLEHMDLLLQAKVLHIETLKLTLYLVKKRVQVGLVRMWQDTVSASSPE